VQTPPLAATRALEAMKEAAEDWKSYAGALSAA